jgi:hypothetical protein
MHVLFGNVSIITRRTTDEWSPDGTLAKVISEVYRVPGRSTTSYGPPPHWSMVDILTNFTDPINGAWAAHSDQPPAWVA